MPVKNRDRVSTGVVSIDVDVPDHLAAVPDHWAATAVSESRPRQPDHSDPGQSRDDWDEKPTGTATQTCFYAHDYSLD